MPWRKSATCSTRPKPPRRSKTLVAQGSGFGVGGTCPQPRTHSPERHGKHSQWIFSWLGVPCLRLMRVTGQSMAPLLKAGEVVLIRERAFERRPPQRGDLVAARPASLGGKAIIKRLSGLPREEIALGGRRWQLNEEQFFLLGEDLDRSFDSRRFGPVMREELIGRVWAKVWPWQILAGSSTKEERR